MYWTKGEKIYPEISEDEFEQIKEIVAEKEKLEKEKNKQINPEPEPFPQQKPTDVSPKKEPVSTPKIEKKPLSFRSAQTVKDRNGAHYGNEDQGSSGW